MSSAFVASLAAFLVTLLSGLGALMLRRHKSAVFAACAGALIGGAVIFLLPDAVHFFEESTSTLSSHVVWAVAALSFAAFYALEKGRHAQESARSRVSGGLSGSRCIASVNG